MYNIIFYTPPDNAEKIKNAMFEAGAGRVGSYRNCSFQTLGTGQFMAMDGANPYVGDIGILHKIEELKIEMVCDAIYIDEVIKIMKLNHPYETPAFHVIKIEDY